MHTHWVIHRDLKTSNLLYTTTGQLKVCDFGMARRFGNPLKAYTADCITLWYRSPEMLLGQKIYSSSVDDWSVGCVIGELIKGKPLLPGQGEYDQIDKTFKLIGAPNEVSWPGIESLPGHKLLGWKLPSRSSIREQFGNANTKLSTVHRSMSENGINLLEGLLNACPERRYRCVDLVHDCEWLYSKNDIPVMLPMDRMPKI